MNDQYTIRTQIYGGNSECILCDVDVPQSDRHFIISMYGVPGNGLTITVTDRYPNANPTEEETIDWNDTVKRLITGLLYDGNISASRMANRKRRDPRDLRRHDH